MAMGVVADTSLPKPDRAVRPEPRREQALVLLAPEPGIPDLYVAQQPFLSDEQQAAAVDLDPSAFQDDSFACIVASRLLATKPGHSCDRGTDPRVLLPV